MFASTVVVSKALLLTPSYTGWLPEDVCVEYPIMIQAGSRIPEEVLGPDELQRVWQEYLGSSD